MYDQLQGMGMTQQQASGWIAQQITNQGLIISANEIFWVSAGIFILLLSLVWFARPPFSAGGGGGGRTLSIRLRDLRVPFLWRQIVQFSLVSVSFAKARHPVLGQDKG